MLHTCNTMQLFPSASPHSQGQCHDERAGNEEERVGSNGRPPPKVQHQSASEEGARLPGGTGEQAGRRAGT